MKTIKRKFYLPLFWKFALAIIFVVLIFGSINAYLIWQDVQKSLEIESEKRAIFIAKSVAEEVITPLLFEDYVTLHKILEKTGNIDSSVVYAFIEDSELNLISSIGRSYIVNQLLDANRLKENQSENVVLLRLKDEESEIIVRDIALPIMQGKLGIVRIGISEAGIKANIIETVKRFWMMVMFFLIVGIIGALVFSLFITKPIKTIQEIADNLSLDSLSEKSFPKIRIREKFFGFIRFFFRAVDEIDILTDKFNDMILRLHDAYYNLQTTQKKLIQSEKLATVGSLASGLAHEINNPIAGVKYCLRRIKQNPKNIEQNNRYIIMMTEAVDRIEKVIKNLLNFSRKEEMIFKPVNLEEVIEKVLILIGHRLEKSHISLSKQIDKNNTKINGSSIHLEQIFMNLLLNAIDAIEECKNLGKGIIKINSVHRNGNLEIFVEDNGIGIPSDKLEKIFNPFYTTKIEGTGLGLAVISRLVEAHMGKISVVSKKNKGSKFILTFPI